MFDEQLKQLRATERSIENQLQQHVAEIDGLQTQYERIYERIGQLAGPIDELRKQLVKVRDLILAIEAAGDVSDIVTRTQIGKSQRPEVDIIIDDHGRDGLEAEHVEAPVEIPDGEQPESLAATIAAAKGPEEDHSNEVSKPAPETPDKALLKKKARRPGEWMTIVHEETKKHDVFTAPQIAAALDTALPDVIRVIKRLISRNELVQLTKGRGREPGTYTHKRIVDDERKRQLEVRRHAGECPKVGTPQLDALIGKCREQDWLVEQRGAVRVFVQTPDGKQSLTISRISHPETNRKAIKSYAQRLVGMGLKA